MVINDLGELVKLGLSMLIVWLIVLWWAVRKDRSK
jgi:hypothetical protein